jgi:hypothetical protein
MKPGRGEMKCNVDTVIFKEQGCYGVGMCLTDDNGDYIVAKTSWFLGLPNLPEADNLAWQHEFSGSVDKT